MPFRVVVHKVIGWTLQDYFSGRDTTLALPEDWLADAADPIGELDAQASVAGLPERQRQCWTLHLAGLEPEQIAAELGVKRNAVVWRVGSPYGLDF